jgi:hypothetical protein
LKKSLLTKMVLATVLAISALGANAQTSAFVTTDYTRASGAKWNSNYETHVGVNVPTSIGAFDIAAIYNINYANSQTSAAGAEGGYSLTTKADNFDLTGRVGFGGIAYDYYYVLQGEAKYTLDSAVQPVAQFRFRDGTDSQYLSQSRGLIGADVYLTKDVAVRLGYTYTYTKADTFNGLTGSLNVAF